MSAPAFLWVSSRLLHVRTSWAAFKTTSTSDSGGVGLTPQNVHGPAAWASPESWAAVQNLRARPTRRICSPTASPHQNVGRTGQLPSSFECVVRWQTTVPIIWDLIPIFFSSGNILFILGTLRPQLSGKTMGFALVCKARPPSSSHALEEVNRSCFETTRQRVLLTF